MNCYGILDSFFQYYNENQQQYPLKPAEVIPGLRPDANNYHDGNGFYYELNRVSHFIR